ncbi:hypothetical protein BWR58_26335 [Shigella sonnei]|nr:hypothetical protein BWR58_26335 [Shigella sonnei]
MLGGADNPNGELPSYITGADNVKVLSAQHVDVLSGVRTLRKQHVGWSGQSKWRITVLYHWR